MVSRLDRWLRVLRLRIRSLFRRSTVEQDLADELAFHREQEVTRHRARGLCDEAASAAAARGMYGVEALKDSCRDTRRMQWIDAAISDARHSLRSLRKSPGFTFVAVAMLAVCIGINAAVFTVANAVLLRGLRSVDRSDQLVFIGEDLSYPDFRDLRAQATSFSELGSISNSTVILNDPGGPLESHSATQVSADTFKVLGQRPFLGRDFVKSDEMAGAPPVAILSYALWRQRYGEDRSLIGGSIRINSMPTTVVGVMPKGFTFPQEHALWLPLVPTPELERREARRLWFAIGRLREGVSLERARGETTAIWRRLLHDHPHAGPVATYGYGPEASTDPLVLNFQQFFVDGNRSTVLRAARPYTALWVAVGIVLVIACANLANLLLARASSRSREMSVRAALGAGRWRLVCQQFIESLMLSLVGAVGGWGLATIGTRVYAAVVVPPQSPWDWHQLVDYSMDTRALAYLLVVSLGTGLIFGMAPAWSVSTLVGRPQLLEAGRGLTRRRTQRLSRVLVIAQIALAVPALTGAGVMIRTFLNTYTADIGFSPAAQLVGFIDLSSGLHLSAEGRSSFFDRLTTRLQGLPGVEAVALANGLPRQAARRVPYESVGASLLDGQARRTVSTVTITPAYFQTLGVTLRAGRDFVEADGPSSVQVAIVNERFAMDSWPGENPLGKRVRLFARGAVGPWLTVVGVAPNVSQSPMPGRFDPAVYVPFQQTPVAGGMWVIVRASVPPATLGGALRREVQLTDPDVAISQGPFTLSEKLAYVYWTKGVNGGLLLIFAGIALLLASIGLYAVIAYAVTQRTQEIGIRTALGATRNHLRALVFGQGMLPVAVGLAVGLPAALAVTPFLKSQLVGVSALDPLTFVLATTTLTCAAAFGCLIPARRVTRVNPMVALRHD